MRRQDRKLWLVCSNARRSSCCGHQCQAVCAAPLACLSHPFLHVSASFAGQGRAPEIRNGSEVEEAAQQLRDILYQAVDAEESDEEDGTGGQGHVAE